MDNTKILTTYGKWMAPLQDSNITAIEDVPLDDVLKMFGPANQVGVKNPHTKGAQPVQYLRQVFTVKEGLQHAKISITAHGLYEVYINGKPVMDTCMNPGFTAYQSFLEYQTYDVTDQITTGANCIAIKLADGWFKGKYGLMAFGGNYGKISSVLFCIETKMEDGTVNYIGSDETMQSLPGAELYSDFLEGEAYDAGKEPQGWKLAEYDASAWNPCTEDVTTTCKNLQPESAEPVRVVDILPVKEVITTPQGDTILDFGANIAGYVEMTLPGIKGETIHLEHFETLDQDGNYYNSIFGYNRNQSVYYTFRGNEEVTYHPAFTFFGFRYVRVSGYSGEIKAENFTAKVLSTDLEQAGAFRCSNEALNQLQENIVRSQVGNFLAIPTDCPQRERAGWTGDVLVYADTALFNQNAEKFFERWLKSVNADQLPNGEIPIVVPYVNGYRYFQKPLMGSDSSSGWGDVIIHLPWSLYQEYGNLELLKAQFPYMKNWMDHVESEAAKKGSDLEDDPYLWNTGFHFGDWLYPSSKDENGNTEMMDGDFCTTSITATAFYAMDAKVMSQISELIGEKEQAVYYYELEQKIKTAFRHAYLKEDGSLSVELQGMYVLALATDLLDEETAQKTAAHLNEMIIKNKNCLDTGFMSIKYLMDVLQRYGYEETAKNVLYQTGCPSWLYEVSQGATTMWETWDAIRTDGVRTPVSYNHYAFGCVGEWMYRELLGLKRTTPGWKTFTVDPTFAFSLDWAEGFHEVNGKKIQLKWKKEGNKVSYDLTVPEGSTAQIPFRNAIAGSISVIKKDTDKNLYTSAQNAPEEIQLTAGEYEIIYHSEV